jgi:hypothetical protein
MEDFDLDLEKLKMPQNFADLAAAKKVWTKIPVRRPAKTEFFKILDREEYSLDAGLVVDEGSGESYLIGDTGLQLELGEIITQVRLVVAMTTMGTLMIWPVKLPTGRRNYWHDTAIEAMNLAKREWVCMRANRHASAYDILVATDSLKEPNWPTDELSFEKILKIAFRDTIIMDADHPMVKQWQGRSL